MQYVIKVGSSKERPCYFASWDGDPGRTLALESAVKFNDRQATLNKIKSLEKKHPNRSFSLKEIIDTTNII